MARDRTVGLLFHEGKGDGASMATLRAFDELIARGWTLEAYVDGPGRLADLLRDRGVDVTERRRHVGFSLRWLRHPPGPAAKLRSMPSWFAGLAGWLRERRPALVHANSLYSLPDALVARGLGFPTYLQLLEMLPEGRKGAAARQVTRRAGIEVGAVSRACAARFAGGSGMHVHLVPTGVPMPPTPAQRPETPDPLVVGTIGAVCFRKGSDVFVAAAERMLAAHPGLEFRIVGTVPDEPDGGFGESALTRARELGVHHLVGADGLAQLQEFDLFLLPSRYDPYPLVVMEALASGVPVVGAAVDGIVEQVVPGTGFLARPEDAADLADKALELVADGELRRAMAAAAREHALQAFRLEDQALAQERAWEATLARTRPTSAAMRGAVNDSA